ncbi:ankyrin repeat domain-containing protein [Chitinophaga sp. RAB17]|uniref:ankyrin repeat domain-containing protein n=1 Tax=Chitinophaga sp. RAB17 TaxID=3233049 RepID=UPI003F93D2CD
MSEKFHQKMQEAFILDDFETMKTLVTDGADVNSVDARDGSPILQRAVIENKKAMIDFLIAHHVDVNKTDRRGMTALHYAAMYKFIDIAETLIDAGAPIDIADQSGNTPLAYAISDKREGYLEMIKLLIDHGANTDIKTRDGRSMLEFYGISLTDI